MNERPAHPRPSRRRFLTRAALGVAGLGLSSVGYAWRIEPHWIEVVRRALPITGLPTWLDGKTLVQISDLHIGPIVDEAYITGAMRKVSSLGADIITITGDFMTCHGTEQINSVTRVLGQLQPGRLATIGILGNHDYAWRWNNVAAANLLTRSLEASGMTVLRNGIADVQGLQVAGVDEFWGPSFDPAATIASLDPRRASLVLCHNPDGVDAPSVWSGYKGWILAGHTHGGQCCAPLLGPPIIPVNNRRYTSGEFDLYDGRRLYINRGLGYLHRVRFNARPEITFFTMRRA